MKTNNKKIKNISTIKNVVLNEDDNITRLKKIMLIEFEDNTFNIVDLKSKEDITNKQVGIDRLKSKMKIIF